MDAHTYKYEAGGGAVLGGIQPQPIVHQADGSLALADIERAIKPDDFHFARSRLLALENTLGGRVIQPEYVEAATGLVHRRGLATHLDGARICNAAVKLGISPRDAVKGFDSVSFCLSKGLGAPVGSVLCGSRKFIKGALRWRKILGGGMRQAGILAAAGLYALEHNIARLAEDHENAARLARGLSDIAQIQVATPDTNMVFVDIAAEQCPLLQEALTRNGIIAHVGPHMRIVLHLDVSRADVDRTIAAFKEFFPG
jgi:threonine aldolase